jgi:hypothetical protein
VEVDLGSIPALSQRVVVGYGNSYELDFIASNPTVPKPAPDGYRVLDDGGSDAVASVWRCVSEQNEGKFCSVDRAGGVRLDVDTEWRRRG